jgi:hypothetical protein
MASDQNHDEINFVEEPFPDLSFSDIDCKDPIFSSESFLLNDCIGKILFFIEKKERILFHL